MLMTFEGSDWVKLLLDHGKLFDVRRVANVRCVSLTVDQKLPRFDSYTIVDGLGLGEVICNVNIDRGRVAPVGAGVVAGVGGAGPAAGCNWLRRAPSHDARARRSTGPRAPDDCREPIADAAAELLHELGAHVEVAAILDMLTPPEDSRKKKWGEWLTVKGSIQD
jgi:hypothetical protein